MPLFRRQRRDLASAADKAQAQEQAERDGLDREEARFAKKSLRRVARQLGLANERPVSAGLAGELLVDGQAVAIELQARPHVYVSLGGFKFRDVNVDVRHDGSRLGTISHAWPVGLLSDGLKEEYALHRPGRGLYSRSTTTKAEFLTGLKDAITTRLSAPSSPTPTSMPTSAPEPRPEATVPPELAELDERPEPVGPRSRTSPLADPEL